MTYVMIFFNTLDDQHVVMEKMAKYGTMTSNMLQKNIDLIINIQASRKCFTRFIDIYCVTTVAVQLYIINGWSYMLKQ